MNHLKEQDFAMSKEQYQMLMGTYTAGNYPKQYVDEAASQLHKVSVVLAQYKEDVDDEKLVNNLMAVDIQNMIKKYTRYAEISKCTTVKLLCSIIIIDLEKTLRNQNFDLKQLL